MIRPVENPPNPWRAERLEWLGPPPPADLAVYEERARSILSKNDSPDVGFNHSVNPYRGCLHGCAYCYARPTHQYLDFGAGTDFECRIVVKVNAPELLRAAFLRPGWKGDLIALSGNTDCYQPLEASYRLTRRILEVCRDFQNPVGLVTKSTLVLRDLDLLVDLARVAPLRVTLSVPFADEAMARAIEPWAPAPKARLRAIRELAEAGVPVGVGVAPIIPGLNDDQVAEVLVRAAEAGATTAFKILLRLPAEVVDVFLPRLAEVYPHRRARVESAIREMREGRLNDPRFCSRMEGTGERWRSIEHLFEMTCRRVGIVFSKDYGPAEAETTFRRPAEQLSLW
ncbi:MAG: PA0069 family radical SAM protein [Planctomycetota bacterium]|jgi:DNA repair photolyase